MLSHRSSLTGGPVFGVHNTGLILQIDSMGPNVLALGPRIALALEGNPETRRRMESAGVDVRTYAGEEISRKTGLTEGSVRVNLHRGMKQLKEELEGGPK